MSVYGWSVLGGKALFTYMFFFYPMGSFVLKVEGETYELDFPRNMDYIERLSNHL